MSVPVPRSLFGLFLTVLLCASPTLAQSDTAAALDSDHDGLSDDVERALLEQFRPTFMITASDCAGKPARFQAGSAEPAVVSRDGTIYGQVFPVSDKRIEVHYYVLWDRDCGRSGHPLDAEHVSALISRDAGGAATAQFWYAAAHEATACDLSSGARAGLLAAEQRGPRVWSSSGKHAMYLRQEMCGHGCGADSCEPAVELAPNGPVIDVGEPAALSKDALWAASPEWTLGAKMDSDFPDGVIAQLQASGDAVATLSGRSSVRGAIRGGGAVLDGAGVGVEHTDGALQTADDKTSKSLGTAARSTGKSLRRAWNAVFGANGAK